MLETKVKIVGISAAHRKNRNTAYMLRVALQAAEEMGGVETDLIELWGRKVKYCIHCDKCLVEPFKCIVKDDMQELYPVLEQADAIIFGVPVFIMGVTGIYRNFMDRLRQYVHTGGFLWKVGATITVAYGRNAGQESTLSEVHTSMRALQMISIGGAGHGAAGCSGLPYGPKPWEDDGKVIAVKNDPYAIGGAMIVGKRVADVAKVVKLGFKHSDFRHSKGIHEVGFKIVTRFMEQERRKEAEATDSGP
ncbi:MAG: flavodoxin family protein [Candidatus Hydrogenedentota bacterium]|nr:MAG: flavodoxin family protein [Candidatus Hydrogenedentota bacterium]